MSKTIKDACGDDLVVRRIEPGRRVAITVNDSVFKSQGRATAELDLAGAKSLAEELIKFLRNHPDVKLSTADVTKVLR